MNQNEFEEIYHDVMDRTLNSLQQLFLLAQQMEQQLNASNCQVDNRQQLLTSLQQIKSVGITLRTGLRSFSSTLEEFLSNRGQED